MQPIQPRPFAPPSRRQAAGLLIVVLLLMLVGGTEYAVLLGGSLILFHSQMAFFISWSGFLLFLTTIFWTIRFRWRRPYQRRLTWVFALALGVVYTLTVVGFVWYFPLGQNLLGSLLLLLAVVSLAQWMKPSSKLDWLLLLSCGLIGGAAAALTFWIMLGPGGITLPMMSLLVLASGLTGLVSGALRCVFDTLWLRFRRSRALGAFEPAAAASSMGFSRRDVLLGLAGLAGLAATGAGFTLLTRSLLAHAFPLVTYKSFGAVKSLSWSPDGKRIVSASEGVGGAMVAIWDTVIGYNISNPRIDYFVTQAVAWSPDGKCIALGRDPSIQNTPIPSVVIIDATTLNMLVSISVDEVVHVGVDAVAWSPDSTRIATAANQIQVWETATGKQQFNIHAPAFVVAWSPNGRYLATGLFDVQVWDADSGALLTTYQGHTDFIQAVAWSPDSIKVASGSLDATVQVWDVRSGTHLLSYRTDPHGATAVAWSPDGSRIVSAEVAGDVHVWNAITGEQVFLYKGHTQDVKALAWSPDGARIASGSDDETIQIWQPM